MALLLTMLSQYMYTVFPGIASWLGFCLVDHVIGMSVVYAYGYCWVMILLCSVFFALLNGGGWVLGDGRTGCVQKHD